MRILLLLTLLWGLALPARSAQLVAGPMAGPPELGTVTLWLQADAAAQAAVEFWPVGETKRQRSQPLALQAAEQFAGHVRLAGLKPGTRYAYRVLLNGKPVGETWQFATQALWHWRTAPPDFTVLAGSCNFVNEPEVDRPGRPYGDRHAEIFGLMAAQKPDLTLWLGDNTYFREVDYGSPEGLAARWAHDRRQPFVQKLLQTGGHAAIWDDHDYGPNDANRSYPLKDDALRLWKRYWANPSYGLAEAPGNFGTFSLNDVDFFLLDNRWYRDDDRLPAADRRMYGEAQMRWLKNALLASTARFKIIAGGTQMLTLTERGDRWSQFPAERDDFLAFLASARVPGVLFMSGDVHRSEVLKLDRPGLYPLHEMTCSALTSGVYVDEKVRDRPEVLPGSVVMGERNFCRLRFEGSLEARALLLDVIDATGATRFSHRFNAADLGSPWPQSGHPAPPRPRP